MLGGACMSKIDSSVFDTGPFIHLDDVGGLNNLKLFNYILITEEVYDELRELKSKISKIKNVSTKNLISKNKDHAKYLIEEYGLDFGEATSISLCMQENVKLFFTDDLEAKEIARHLGLDAHGTIAIITRCFREGIISKQEAVKYIRDLYDKSSLFITIDLVKWTINAIEKFKV